MNGTIPTKSSLSFQLFGLINIIKRFFIMDNIAKGIPHMSLDIDEEFVVENATPLREKQGHSCCGGCCDVRRAVIIICIINITRCFSQLLLSAITMSMANEWQIIPFARIVAAGLAMLGAFTFNKYLVAINVISLLVPTYVSSIVWLLINGLFLFPHVFLIRYIHNGIMTKENYPYERQSCCCVPPVVKANV